MEALIEGPVRSADEKVVDYALGDIGYMVGT